MTRHGVEIQPRAKSATENSRSFFGGTEPHFTCPACMACIW